MNISVDTLCVSGTPNIELASNQQLDDATHLEFSDCLQEVLDEKTIATNTDATLTKKLVLVSGNESMKMPDISDFAATGNVLPDSSENAVDEPMYAMNEDDVDDTFNNAVAYRYPSVITVANIPREELSLEGSARADTQYEIPSLDKEVVLNNSARNNKAPLLDNSLNPGGDLKFTSYDVSLVVKNPSFYKNLAPAEPNLSIDSSLPNLSNVFKNDLDSDHEAVLFKMDSAKLSTLVEDQPVVIKNEMPVSETNLQTISSFISAPITTEAKPSTPTDTPPVFSQPLKMDHPDWPSEFSERIVWMQGNNVSAAKVHVHPQELGSIDFQIHVKDGITHITMNAEQKPVQEMLEKTMPALVNLLQEGGLKPENIIVTHSGAQLNTNFGSQKQDQTSPQEQRNYLEDLFEENMQVIGTSEIQSTDSQRLIDYYA